MAKKIFSDLDLNGGKIRNVGSPTQSGDVATYDWTLNVLDGAKGFSWKHRTYNKL